MCLDNVVADVRHLVETHKNDIIVGYKILALKHDWDKPNNKKLGSPIQIGSYWKPGVKHSNSRSKGYTIHQYRKVIERGIHVHLSLESAKRHLDRRTGTWADNPEVIVRVTANKADLIGVNYCRGTYGYKEAVFTKVKLSRYAYRQAMKGISCTK
jgi:hypothetical protein